VLEVLDGSPVSEVAVRYGVSRQRVYTWKARASQAGSDGLKEVSRRPRTSPKRLAAETEALVCELRRVHPRWGARRIAFELAQRGAAGGPSRAPGAGPQRDGGAAAAAASAEVPAEVLTDNGKQFTGRFTRPRPAEVLFERVSREYGITARLTRPYSPTTTGKIERWHQTLRRELLDASGPFADLPSPQASISGWVKAYNHYRPHQSLGMATPASLFRPGTQPDLALVAAPRRAPEQARVPAQAADPVLLGGLSADAVEFDAVIAASGLLPVIPGVQRIRMGAGLAGQRAHIWADELSDSPWSSKAGESVLPLRQVAGAVGLSNFRGSRRMTRSARNAASLLGVQGGGLPGWPWWPASLVGRAWRS
jgi:integrase-like protein/homeodomain-containing protein